MVFRYRFERRRHHAGDVWIGGQHDKAPIRLENTCKFLEDRWIEVMGDRLVDAPWRIRDDGGEVVRLERVGEKILLADEKGPLHFAVWDFTRLPFDGFHKLRIDLGSENAMEGCL